MVVKQFDNSDYLDGEVDYFDDGVFHPTQNIFGVLHRIGFQKIVVLNFITVIWNTYS